MCVRMRGRSSRLLTHSPSVRFTLGLRMRTSLKLIGALLLLSSFDALAAPKKKGAAPVARPPAAAPAAPRKEAPTVNLSSSRPPVGASESTPEPSGGGAPTRGPTRIDFDDRL